MQSKRPDLPTFKFKPAEKFRIERDVKAEVKKLLDVWRAHLWANHGNKIFDFMPVSNGMGKHGVPDFNICFLGHWVSVETKYGGKEPTARQAYQLKEITLSRGYALVVDETNVAELHTLFCDLYERFTRKLQIL